MTTWALAAGAAWVMAQGLLDLDCARPAAARDVVGQVMLSEIEGAEDIHRAAMWEAFGRCEPAGREACVGQVQARFEAQWSQEKAAIEAKYRAILDAFEVRCRASPA